MIDLNSLTGGAQNLLNNNKNKINNAFSQFDNKIKESISGKGGFASKFKGKLSNFANGFSDKLMGSMKSFMSKDIMGLNKLKGLFSKFGFDPKGMLFGLLGNLQGYLQGLLENAIGMLMDLKDDFLKQLQNAAVSFISNIVEDFYNNIRSMMFIPDVVFCQTIKTLYYGGADLAYFEHYIRNSCLKRDWYHTLEFVDSQYEIIYNRTYNNLETDIMTCAKHSCHNNLFYIFNQLYKEISNYRVNIKNIELEMNKFTNKKDRSTPQYKELYNLLKKLQREEYSLRSLMVKYLKVLIVFSTNYVTYGAIQKFFTHYGDILKPKYYGETDDIYNQKYKFTIDDCLKMMPAHGKMKKTESDKYTMKTIKKEAKELKKASITSFNITEFDKKNSSNNDIQEKHRIESRIKTKEKLEKYRSNMLKTQSKRIKSLYNTALTTGAKGVHEANLRKFPRNQDRKVVKYKVYEEHGIKAGLNTVFNYDSDVEYIDLRNENIKHIYSLLSSNIYGEDKLVNKYFFERCKIKTSTNLKNSVDKMTGIIGSSMAAQSLYDLSDSIDSSAYKYLKKVEKFLLDPKINRTPENVGSSIVQSFTWDDTKIIDDLVKDIKKELNENDSKGIINGINDLNKIKNNDHKSNRGSNPNTVNKLKSKLNKNIKLQNDLVEMLRFISMLPMIAKRDIMFKYLMWFYDLLIKQKITTDEASKVYEALVESVYGKPGITDPNKLHIVFEYSSNDSLNENVKTLITINLVNSVNEFTNSSTSKNKDLINYCYKLAITMMSIEIEQLSFAKALFLHDKDYLKSLLKQKFYSQINYLTQINEKDNRYYNQFYNLKDNITLNFFGYDMKGVFGYDENGDKRFKFTNVLIGDYNDVVMSSPLTPNSDIYIAGSDYTNGNGIKKVNHRDGIIENTQFNTGDWKIVQLHNRYVFFIKDNKEIYYLKGNKIIFTEFKNYDKYNLESIDYNNIIILNGKDNNGLYIWNGNSFTQLHSKGDNYIYKYVNTGVLFCSDKKKMPVIYANSDSNFKIVNESLLVNSVSDHVITRTVTIPPGDSGNVSPTIINSYQYNLFIATNNGLMLYSCESSTNNNYYQNITFNDEISKNWNNYTNGNTIIHKIDKNNCILIKNTKKYNIELSEDKNYVVTQNNLEKVIKTIDGESEYNPDTEPHDIHYIKDFNKVILITTINKKIFILDKSNNTLTSFTNSDFNGDIKDLRFISKNNEQFIFGIVEKDIILLNLNDKTYNTILLDVDKKEGWEFINVEQSLFLVNHTKSLGLRYFNNIKAINTGIVEGIWNVTKSNDHYFALSIKGTNKGIMISEINSVPHFIYPNDVVKFTEGDIGGYLFDRFNNKMYFTANRRESIFDIKNYKYDIDEFIYGLSDYQIHKTLEEFIINENFNIIDSLNVILDKLFIDPSFGNNSVGLTINDLNNPYPPVKIVLKDVIKLFEIILRDLRLFKRNSSLFNELIDYMNAKDEFDIDNNEILNQLTGSFILNDPSKKEIGIMDIESNTRILYIKSQFEFNESTNQFEIIDNSPSNTEWDKTYDMCSEDYMDSY